MPAGEASSCDPRINTRHWPLSRDCLVQAAAGLNWRTALQAAWPAALLACLMLVPFLHKAFTVDDGWFMAQAEHVTRHPLQPTNFDICWFAIEQCGKSWSMSPGQSLVAYLLMPSVLAGGAEWVAHLMELLCATVAIVSMALIALRLGWDRHHARLAALLLVAIPPFLPVASTAMPDMPALALGLFGLERLLAWKTHGRVTAALAASLALGLSPFARPHYVALLGLAFLCLIDEPRWSGVREVLRPARLAPLVGALAVVAGTVWLARQGGGRMAPPRAMMRAAHFSTNLKAYLIYFVWPIPWAPLWAWLRRREKSFYLAACASTVLFLPVLMARGMAQSPALWTLLAFAAMAAFGTAALFDAWFCAFRQRSAYLALLLAWMLMPAPAVLYLHMPVRYFAGTVPACILLLFEVFGKLPRRSLTTAAFAVAAIGILHSAMILHSDNDAAGMARTAVRRLVAPRVAAGEGVWFSGQWGFRWYAGHAGAHECWPGKSDPAPGDLLVVGELEGAKHALDRFPRRVLVDSLSFQCSCGRTLPPRGGLYSNWSTPLLWSWGSDELNRYEVWRIE